MPEQKTFYITTPIYYPSDNLHVGHAYTTVAGDCMARFKRMQGFKVCYLTGTDEHGQKIERAARAKGLDPLPYIDGIVKNIRYLWEVLLITHTDFIRTTESRHTKIVQKLFQKVYDKGDIYLSEYEGWYCTPCETFFTQRQLADGKCPDCGREVELVKEESYFFKMSKYADKLLQHINANPGFIQPESRRNEVINFIKGGLEDLSVSRTTFSWGIPVPFDDRHVVYVWFDALINYISALGYGEDQRAFSYFWPADVHLMAKDILRFHAIIWPIILMAADIPLPRKVFAHGWIMLEGGKMSKSKGNVIDPILLVDKYGVDAVRYYLLKELSLGQDGVYSEDMLINRCNSDLANDLGNLISRSNAMILKYFDGQLPAADEETDLDRQLKDLAAQVYLEATANLEKLDFSAYIISCSKLIARANKYIDESEPWLLAKDVAFRPRLGTVLYNLIEAIRISLTLLAPAMPALIPRCNRQVNLFPDWPQLQWDKAGVWGLTPAQLSVVKGEPLFPRIEVKQEKINTAGETPAVEPEVANDESYISIEDFAKLDLRVAEVIACEPMKKADKLLILRLKVGDSERTVVSGIALHYKPEDLVGKRVVLVANLKPTKLRGVLSEGMILAASDLNNNKVEVLLVDEIEPGNRVK